jgi:hypothetical protein
MRCHPEVTRFSKLERMVPAATPVKPWSPTDALIK